MAGPKESCKGRSLLQRSVPSRPHCYFRESIHLLLTHAHGSCFIRNKGCAVLPRATMTGGGSAVQLVMTMPVPAAEAIDGAQQHVCVQARMMDVCIVFAALAASESARRKFGSATATGWANAHSSALAAVEATTARCLRAKAQQMANAPPMLPLHYATLLQAFMQHGNGDKALWTEVAETAGHEMASAERAWPTQHVVSVVEAAAGAKLRAHTLFETAAPLVLQRLAAAPDADQERPMGRRSVIGGAYSGLTAEEMERALWAFAVVRRSYPYTARSVVTGVAKALTMALTTKPSAVPIDTLAAMLWTCAAASHTPRALFMAAVRAVDELPEAPNAEVRESLTWSFNRAGISVPRHCQSDATWFL